MQQGFQEFAYQHGVQGVGSSNLLAPTNKINDLQRKLYVNAALYFRQKLIYFASFFIFAPIFSTTCHAGETWLDLNLTSYHIHTEHHYNQVNYGAGLEYHATDEVMYMAGAFRNSYDRNSVYALAGWTPLQYGIVHAGAVVGAVSGYPGANNGHFGAMMAGIVRVEYLRTGLNVILIPPAVRDAPWTIGFQAKFKF